MKRYLVFYCEPYYPKGGMKDLINMFDDLDEANKYLSEKSIKEEFYGGGHIYDTQTNSIVRNVHEEKEEDLIDFNDEYLFENCTQTY